MLGSQAGGAAGPKALVTLNSLTIYTVGREGSSSGVKGLPGSRPAHRSHTAMLECPRRLCVPQCWTLRTCLRATPSVWLLLGWASPPAACGGPANPAPRGVSPGSTTHPRWLVLRAALQHGTPRGPCRLPARPPCLPPTARTPPSPATPTAVAVSRPGLRQIPHGRPCASRGQDPNSRGNNHSAQQMGMFLRERRLPVCAASSPFSTLHFSSTQACWLPSA